MTPDRKTTEKNRVISNGQHIARVDEETTEYLLPRNRKKHLLNSIIRNDLKNRMIDVIIFVDYDKGVITPSIIKKVTSLAKLKNIPIAADPKKRNFKTV